MKKTICTLTPQLILFFLMQLICFSSSNAQVEKGLIDFLSRHFGKCDDFRTSKTMYTSVDCNKYQHGEWVLVFSDEFNNNALDTAKWFTCEDGWNRKHGDERQYYKDENVIVLDNQLHLVAKEDPGYYEYWDFDNEGNPFLNSQYFSYTSGWLQSRTQFKYGLIEVSCRIPSGAGLWPAFWLFGEIPNSTNLSLHSEVDIFEFKGENTSNCNQNYHLWENGSRYTCEEPPYFQEEPFSDDYHIYSLEWDEFRLVFRVDGNITRTVYRYVDLQGRIIDECNNLNNYQLYIENLLFPTTPMHVILNLAISNGNYGSPPNESTQFPSFFDIDYIRIYKKSNPYRNLIISQQPTEAYYTAGNILFCDNENPLVLNNETTLNLFALNEIVFEAEVDIPRGATLDAAIITPSDLARYTNNAAYKQNMIYESDYKRSEPSHESSFEIIPNPTTGRTSLLFSQKDDSNKYIFIKDSQGRVVFQRSISSQQSILLPITLPSGIYTVFVVSPTEIKNKTLLIE